MKTVIKTTIPGPTVVDFSTHNGKVLLIKKHTSHIFTSEKGMLDTLQFIHYLDCLFVKMTESREESFAQGKQF